MILYNILLHGLILKDIPADPQGLYWLRYFFLTNSVIPAPNDFWGNLSATWTISLFMAFYLLVPVFVRLIRGCTSAFFCYVLALILRYLWVKTGYGDYVMIFYYLHYFLLGMLVWEIHQAGRRIGAQLLVYIGMIAAAGAGLALGRAQTDSFIWYSDYLPHNYPQHCVVYTGTHDNDTVMGWMKTAPKDCVRFAKDYLRCV